MRLLKASLSHVQFLSSLFLLICVSGASAQQKPNLPAAKNSSVVKRQSPAAQPAETQEQASPVNAQKADSAELIRKREEWFYKQRSSVNGHIPAGARLKAFQHMQRMMAAEGKLVQRPDGSYAAAVPQAGTSVGGTWNSIGPTPTTGGTFSPVTGRITTIAVDPSDSTGNTVLIGGAQGGVWRSTDAGQTWNAVGDQNPSLAMGSIAFAASQPSIVYAGTGEADSVIWDLYYGAGVLKSTDGGLHWTQTCTVASSTCPFIGPYDDITPFGLFTLGGTRISYIAVNPSNPQMVLVGAQTQFSQGPTEGVYCSDNGGATWTNILPDQLSSFVGFASSTVAYAALGNPFGSSPNAPNGNGIYKATGIGGTCKSVNFTRLTATSLPLQSSMGRIDLGIAPSDTTGNSIYASIADASIDPVTGFRRSSRFNVGIFKTTDGGNSWINTNAPDICQRQCEYDNVIKVDPLHSSTAFFGGSARRDANGNPTWVVRTTDGGNSWSSVIPPLPALGQPADPGVPHVDNHAIAFAKLPTGKVRMYLGNDGGIWRTDDAEAATITWTNLNNPSLTLSQFYPSISIHPSSPAIGFGGTQDNGSQQLAGAPSWVQSTRTINTASGPVVGQACGDGGQTAVDSQIPSTVYISCQGISVQSSVLNGSAGSFVISINGINPSDFSSFIPPLATDPNAAGVLYFGTTGVYQSVDSAVTWTPITGPLANGPGDYIAVLAVAPGNSSVVYAGGFHGGVFVATNVGAGTAANFSQVSGQLTLPPRAATAIAVDPADKTGMTAYVTFSGFSFVSTSLGVNDPTGHVFKTMNGGASWTDVSCSVAVCTTPAVSDLPNIPVNDIVVDPDLPNTIYAATDVGVFMANCTVSPCTWSTLGSGLARVAVLSLRLHEPSRTLRAGTHGRGAWDINLNNFNFSGPHLSSITPTSANVGGPQFSLTVNGIGLTGGSIQWNGSVTGVTTTQVSDTKLTASIAASLLTLAGTAKITVVNLTQTSNSLTFAVLASIPTLTGLNPSSAPVQTSPATPIPIQLIGTGFSSNVKVLFNGAQNGITVGAPTASCQPPTCLTATLPASLLGPFGSTNDITVLNTPPGGGQSKPVTFKVVAPPPPNDNFGSATPITTLSFFDTQDSSGATTEAADPVPPATCLTQFPTSLNTGGHPNGLYNTIWYKFTPIFSANLEVDTIGSTYDTVLSIWTGTGTTEATLTATNVACDDDIIPRVNIQSQLMNVPLTTGTTYYIMVSSFGPPDPNPIALGGRSQFNFTYNNGYNPIPTITSISPASVNSGDPGFTLMVTGTGFLNGASAFLRAPAVNGTLQPPTTFVSSTQLTATIPASAILLPGPASVFVDNPQPTIGDSNFVTLTINVGTYPVPTLTSTTPTTVIAGSLGPITVGAAGTNFAQSAVLNLNGVPQPTTVNFSQGLFAIVPGSAFATAGTIQVTVTNPTPGGGISNALPLTVAAPNPLPTITSISPTSAVAGSLPNLTVTGTGFLLGASVFINGQYYPANFLSSTQLTVPLSNFNNIPPGSYPVYVVDPAPGGTSNSANFTVTGPPPDFSLNYAGATSATVTAGQTATFINAVYVFALNGFTGTVKLSCSLPAAATQCSVSPSSVPPQQAATVTVTTTTRGLMPPSLPTGRFYLRPQWVPLFLLTLLLALVFLRFARTRRQRLAGVLPLAVLVLFLILQATGCGGGGSSGPPPPTGTPAGTYTVTVTGISGSTTHTTTLTLTVN